MPIDLSAIQHLLASDAERPSYRWTTTERAEKPAPTRVDRTEKPIPGWLKGLIVSVPLAALADMATTEMLIHKGGASGEQNPLMRHPVGRFGLKPALATGVTLGALALGKRGKHAKATALAFVPAAGWTAAAAWNATQLKKVK